MTKKLPILILLIALAAPVRAGNFITGLGYLYPEKYRRDNEINPLPFGLSVFPMIAYRGDRFSLFGPRATFRVIKGLVGLNLNVNIGGDNYKANILNQRDTAIHAGASLIIPFFSIRYEQDVSSTHNSNVLRLTLRAPIPISKDLFIRTSLSQEFTTEKFNRYYYGVTQSEVGLFELYTPGRETSIIINMNASYKLSKSNSLNLNWTHTRFGKEIANSPTIRLKNWNTFGLFWNYTI